MTYNREKVILLKRTISCNFADNNAEHYIQLDKELNELFKKSQKGFFQILGHKTNEMHKTEQAWLRYKDLWEEFGHSKCPKVQKNTWAAILTEQRIAQIKLRMG